MKWGDQQSNYRTILKIGDVEFEQRHNIWGSENFSISKQVSISYSEIFNIDSNRFLSDFLDTL